MSKIDEIKKELDELKKGLLIVEPAHFSKRDLIDAFFGALFLGVTFAIKGLLIQVSLALDNLHLVLIVISTLLLLTAEIYFIGYNRVIKKSQRRFGQFWLKRIVSFYFVAVLTATFLVYLFGLNSLPDIANNFQNVLRLIVLISLPCGIGAAITDLLKQY